MDLKAIAAFRAVVELGSISRASAYLRLAQPALSRLIQKLEHRLGVKLLQRSSTGVTPTAAGRLLLERTAALEVSLADIEREVSGYANEVLGPLRVGVQPPFSHVVMPELVKRYVEAHPRVEFHLHEGYSADMVDGLLDETIDVVVAETPSHPSRELLVLPLWVEALHLIGPAGGGADPLEGGTVTLARALDLPLILPSQRYAIRRLVEQVASREHLRVKPFLEVDGPDLIFSLVRAGLGFTLMPMLGINPSSRRAELRSVPTTPAIDRSMSILVRAAVAAEPKVATLVRMLRQSVSALAATDRFSHIRLTFDAAAPPPAQVPSSGLRAIEGGRAR